MTSCGAGGPRPNPASNLPDESRFRPVAAPAIPPAATPCAHDPAQLCNTDAETAGVIVAYDGNLGEANRRICWLRVRYGFPACPTAAAPAPAADR